MEVLVGNMRIDLSSGDVGVSQERLDRAQIGAVLKQIGGKAVAYRMRAYFF